MILLVCGVVTLVSVWAGAPTAITALCVIGFLIALYGDDPRPTRD